MKHTQGKWKYCKQLTRRAFGDYRPAEFVYELFEGEKYIGQFNDESNAKRIVQIHNSFDGVVKSLKATLAALEAEIEGRTYPELEPKIWWENTIKDAKSAIAKAEGSEVVGSN